MRPVLVLLTLALAAGACSGTTSESPSAPTSATSAPTTVASSSTTTTIAGTTSTTSAQTTSTSPESTTTTSLLENQGAICGLYADYLNAQGQSEVAAALRSLSIAFGFPRSVDVTSAIDVLRGRTTDRSESAARTILDAELGNRCVPLRGSEELDSLFDASVLVGGPGGVGLLDGTELIAADPAGTHLAAFDDSQGGIFTLLEIQGLEIIDHRSDVAAVPRDLVLAEDARLHDAARHDGVDVGVVTIWELEGEFGELAQNLYLAPFDGSELVAVAAVGDLLAGAETVSYSAGTFLVTESELGGPSTIYSLDAQGQRNDAIPGLPLEAGPVDDPAVEALQFGRLAPDGRSFAYLRARPSVGAGATGDLRTDVVLQRIDDGVEFMSIEIGAPTDQHTSLDFDGRTVIVTTRDRLFVVDTTGNEGPELSIRQLTGAEFAYFLDSGIARAGDG